jgi:hypothetical protein
MFAALIVLSALLPHWVPHDVGARLDQLSQCAQSATAPPVTASPFVFCGASVRIPHENGKTLKNCRSAPTEIAVMKPPRGVKSEEYGHHFLTKCRASEGMLMIDMRKAHGGRWHIAINEFFPM